MPAEGEAMNVTARRSTEGRVMRGTACQAYTRFFTEPPFRRVHGLTLEQVSSPADGQSRRVR